MTDLLQYGDPVLTRPCPEEEFFDGGLRLIADDLSRACHRPGRWGVAAPQLGISRRLFAFLDGGRNAGTTVIVNPRVVWHRGNWEYREGCLSMPGFSWPLARPKQVKVLYQDLDGGERELEADEFLARGIQHEIDHLDGVLLADRLREAAPGMIRQQRRAMERALAKFGVPVPA